MTLREKLAPTMATIAGAGSAIDIWSHDLTGKAILLNRHIVSTIPVIGDFMAEHSGNMFRSTAPIVVTTLIAEGLRTKAEEIDSERLNQVANAVEFSGLLAVTAANLIAESFKNWHYFIPENAQFWGDLGAGVGIMLIAYYGTKGLIDLHHRKQAESRNSAIIDLSK